jgi:hypothetical protein
MARLCFLAYQRDKGVISGVLQSWAHHYELEQGYHRVRFLEGRGIFDDDESFCYGFVWFHGSSVYIVIRGTREIEDFVLDALAIKTKEGIHSGFNYYADRIWHQVTEILTEDYPFQLGDMYFYVSGHSLGGAAAILIARMLWINQMCPTNSSDMVTYTFGAPRIGNANIGLSTPLFRYRTSGDLIPFLPPETIFQYFHIGPEYLISHKETLVYKVDRSLFGRTFKFIELLATFQRVDRSLVAKLLTEHRIERYIEAMAPSWYRTFVKNK